MLSKSATMLLGLINQRPLNPYEIIKQLQIMNVHRWYNIANSTVYATLKALEKKEYIYGSMYQRIISFHTYRFFHGGTHLWKFYRQKI